VFSGLFFKRLSILLKFFPPYSGISFDKRSLNKMEVFYEKELIYVTMAMVLLSGCASHVETNVPTANYKKSLTNIIDLNHQKHHQVPSGLI